MSQIYECCGQEFDPEAYWKHVDEEHGGGLGE
jgi:hypothetical protein